MEVLWSIWNGFNSFLGYVGGTLLSLTLIGAGGFYCWWRMTRAHCPTCGGINFRIMIGGPPKCATCGWQEEVYMKGQPRTSTFDRRRGYHLVK